MIAEIEHGSTETDSEKGLPMQSSDESSLRRVGKKLCTAFISPLQGPTAGN
jgi:hypothetical protein